LKPQRWVAPVLILLGMALLVTAGGSYLIASQTPAGETALTEATIIAAEPIATPTPIPATPMPTPTPTLPSPPEVTNTAEPVPAQSLTFDGETAYEHVLAQVALGPRPTGSEAGWATGNLIMAELQKLGWQTEAQEFFFKGVRGRNVIARREGSTGPVIIIGAHYDTRPAADQEPVEALRKTWIEGANDGASGVAVLLELARVLESNKLKNDVWLAFFDAEDRGRLEGWPFSVGAREMAGQLTVNPQAVVVIDMIGDANQQLFYERNSTPQLSQEIWAVAAELGYQGAFIPEARHTIIDDHLPFLERLIPAVDIIDFDYPYWHTVEDTADKVSAQSLERVGRTLEVWLEEKQ
jgi:hypothetical protein